jgi:hypothetical protein
MEAFGLPRPAWAPANLVRCRAAGHSLPYNYSKLLKLKAILLDLNQGISHLKVEMIIKRRTQSWPTAIQF